MIPPHLFYQICLSFLEQNDCTPPKCGKLSEYTDSAHTEVKDLSSRQKKNKWALILTAPQTVLYINGLQRYIWYNKDGRKRFFTCTILQTST